MVGLVSSKMMLKSTTASFLLTVLPAYLPLLLLGTVLFSQLTSPPRTLNFSDKLGIMLELILVD